MVLQARSQIEGDFMQDTGSNSYLSVLFLNSRKFI